jgi:hypothetical protein
MRRSTVMLSLAALAVPAMLSAQQPYSECNQPLVTISQQNINICNAAVDGAKVFHPVLGLLVSGGNPVLGSTQTLGGFPHFSFTARVNATELSVPDLGYDGNGTTVTEDDEIFAPAPLVEAAIGILKGFGPTGILSVDLLGSAQLLPTTQIDNLTVDKDARKIGDIALGLGYGARVGVLRGGGFVPTVTVSAMRRSIPKITYGDENGGDTYEFGLDLTATNLRAIAGYKVAVFTFGAGLGYDKYTGDVDISFESQAVPGTVIPVSLELDNTRTMVFLTGALDLPVFKIGADIGYQSGKDQNLRTTFQNNDPADSRLFAGAGLRFSF